MKSTFSLASIALIMFLSTIGCQANKTKSTTMETTMEQSSIQSTYTPPVKTTDKKYPRYQVDVKQGDVALGSIVLELFTDIAPKHCANFDSLVSVKFFDGIQFHRVIPGFMIQGGDPNTKDLSKRDRWGVGDPSQKNVPAEFNKITHSRGILSAARKGNDINSATSQFFLVVANSSFLDEQYTVYGQAVSGMEVADKVVSTERDGKDCPLKPITMTVKKL